MKDLISSQCGSNFKARSTRERSGRPIEHSWSCVVSAQTSARVTRRDWSSTGIGPDRTRQNPWCSQTWPPRIGIRSSWHSEAMELLDTSLELGYPTCHSYTIKEQSWLSLAHACIRLEQSTSELVSSAIAPTCAIRCVYSPAYFMTASKRPHCLLSGFRSFGHPDASFWGLDFDIRSLRVQIRYFVRERLVLVLKGMLPAY